MPTHEPFLYVTYINLYVCNMSMGVGKTTIIDELCSGLLYSLCYSVSFVTIL